MYFFSFLHRRTSLLFLALILLAGCATNSEIDFNPNGRFTAAGLQEARVNVFHLRDDVLFAGTNHGLLKKELNSKTNEWIYGGLDIGLDADSIEVVDIIAWNTQELLVARSYYLFETDPPFTSSSNKMLVKTTNGGKSWINLTDNFFPQEKYAHVGNLTFSVKKTDRIFAKGGLPIARSKDRGKSWEKVFGKWKYSFTFGKFIKIVPDNPNIVWAGGANNIFQPTLFKSTDSGDTWNRLSFCGKPFCGMDATVHDVVFHPDNPEFVLAGLSGSVSPARVIRKTTDGGKTWKTVLDEINTYTFTHSAQNAHIVYASGRNASATLFFVVSTDFGESWQWIQTEKFSPPVFINDIVSAMEDGHEVLYFATNKGVYSYTFE